MTTTNDEKVRITQDRVISRGKGKTKFYADDGTIATLPMKQVLIYESEERMREVIAEEEAAAASAPQPEAETTEQVSIDEQAAPDAQAAAPASSPKRGKGKKAKEQKMATKKASKKKAAKKASNGALIRVVAGREHDISNYYKVKNASGHTSYDNGDKVAEMLRGKDLDTVYDIASKKLKEDVKTLKAKYKHLNPGMQRMSLGNRLRKVVNG